MACDFVKITQHIAEDMLHNFHFIAGSFLKILSRKRALKPSHRNDKDMEYLFDEGDDSHYEHHYQQIKRAVEQK